MAEHFTATVHISKTSTTQERVNHGSHSSSDGRQVDKEIVKLVLRAPTLISLVTKLGKHIELIEEDEVIG